MIYVWLSTIKVMIRWASHEEYWDSIAYQSHEQGIMVEKETPIWRE